MSIPTGNETTSKGRERAKVHRSAKEGPAAELEDLLKQANSPGGATIDQDAVELAIETSNANVSAMDRVVDGSGSLPLPPVTEPEKPEQAAKSDNKQKEEPKQEKKRRSFFGQMWSGVTYAGGACASATKSAFVGTGRYTAHSAKRFWNRSWKYYDQLLAKGVITVDKETGKPHFNKEAWNEPNKFIKVGRYIIGFLKGGAAIVYVITMAAGAAIITGVLFIYDVTVNLLVAILGFLSSAVAEVCTCAYDLGVAIVSAVTGNGYQVSTDSAGNTVIDRVAPVPA